MCEDANDLILIANTIVNILSKKLENCDIFLLAVLLENIASQLKKSVEVEKILEQCLNERNKKLKDKLDG